MDPLLLIDHLPDPVVVLDAGGVVTWASPSIEVVVGWRPEQLVGRPATDLFVKRSMRGDVRTVLDEVVARPGRHGPVAGTLATAAGGMVEVEFLLDNRLDDPDLAGVVVSVREMAHPRLDRTEWQLVARWALAMLEGAGLALLVLDRAGLVVWASPDAGQLLGRDERELVGTDLLAAVHADDRALLGSDPTRDLLVGGGPRVLRFTRPDGSVVALQVRSDGSAHEAVVGGAVLSLADAVGARAAEDLLAAQATTLERIARGTPVQQVIESLKELIAGWLPGVTCVLGVRAEEGRIAFREQGLPRPMLLALNGSGLSAPGSVGPELELVRDLAADPRTEAVADAAQTQGLVAAWLLGAQASGTDTVIGSVVVLLSEARDPTEAERRLLSQCGHLAALAIERDEFEARLRHHATHDELTGLPNRQLLLERIRDALVRHRPGDVGLVVLDFDRFKVLNDSLGHRAGDQLLRAVAERLRALVRPGDAVGRFGGDEFVIVLEAVGGEREVVAVADRLAEGLAEPFDLDGVQGFLTVSMGIALSTEGDTAERLVRNADLAMFRAKQGGRNQSVVFRPDLREQAVYRAELETELRSALDADLLYVLFQPQVRVPDRAVVGVEALVRWRTPARGAVPPGDFVELAEESGLIVPLGRWVLDQAVEAAIAWPEPEDRPPLGVTVNLSMRQLREPDLVGDVTAVLERHGLPPERLCLEVTETDLAHDPDASARRMAELKGLGIRLAIDDFGVGYASLDYARRFAMADVLKIDATFITGIADPRSKDRAIVSAAIALGRALGFQVVAEGVETEEQFDVLTELGADMVQGFLISRAVDSAGVAALLGA